MLRPLESSDKTWLGSYANDFHNRFLSLLSYRFQIFDAKTALSINESATSGARLDTSYSPAPLTKEALDQILTPFDMKRLAAYANNLLDYHVICKSRHIHFLLDHCQQQYLLSRLDTCYGSSMYSQGPLRYYLDIQLLTLSQWI